MTDPRRALLLEAEAIGRALDGLDEDAFASVTNCPPWTLKELVVHLWGTLGQATRPFEDAPGPPRSAAEYFGRSERETAEYRSRNVDQTQAVAGRFATGGDAVAAFVGRARRHAEHLRDADLDRVVAERNMGAMTIGGYLSTRVVALAAHGLDVTISLGREPVTTPGALAISANALTELLGADRPTGWTDADLLAFGTGRRPLDVDARAGLGPLADKFPLLS